MANEQPTVYLFVADEQTRDISISSFPADHPDYERYHLLIREGGGNHVRTPVETSMNILRNVLTGNGVKVVLE
jgi:hypothetical protein